MSPRIRSVNWPLLAVIALSSAFFLAGLNRLPVPTVDGAVRAVEACNMVRTGDWFPVTLHGYAVADHPPLYIWLSALSFKIFGMTDFAANLPTHLFAVATVLMTFFVALESGMSAIFAILAALILCLTRDFVLSSVRGYIEPIFTFFVMAGLWCTLHFRKSDKLWAAVAAGLCVWGVAFSKGPPALWPLLFFALLIIRSGSRQKIAALSVYLGIFGACIAGFIIWNNANGYWYYWNEYFQKQILGSALGGRGSQQLEPLYFLDILLKFYWPWLLLLIYGIHILLRDFLFSIKKKKPLSRIQINNFYFGLLALGFVGGFSIMKWKFWYYIAPAYPAMALFMAGILESEFSNHRFFKQDANKAAKALVGVSVFWMILVSILPVSLHRERVPEVMDFKDAIYSSSVKGPVWFLYPGDVDHNEIGTSGEWYFDKVVEKVEAKDEFAWEKDVLPARAWLIIGKEYWGLCKYTIHVSFCEQSDLIVESDRLVLAFYKR